MSRTTNLDLPMPSEAEPLIAAGNAALSAGDWSAARDAFQAVLADREVAEARYGLGEALWWLGDMSGTLANFERAYAAFRRRPEPAHAAGVAMRIGFHSLIHLANEAAAAGWLGRAKRLVEEHDIEELRGELLLMQACGAEHPASGESHARAALEVARSTGDLDLELCALSWLGASLVEQGRLEEGMPLLDEAMAGSLGGEAARLETIVFTSCNLMNSCARCAAFEGATQWVRAAERFVERYGCPFLYAECRAVYGGVLLATGEWAAAERELAKAIELARDSVPAFHARALAALAELRLAQGRLEEVERLVAGLEGHGSVVPVVAALHLRHARPAAARAELRRRLDVLGEDQLESALLLELLGDAEIALGGNASAAERGRALAAMGAACGCPVVVARGERLRGHALAATDARAARPHLDAALHEFVRLAMPYEIARTRYRIAAALGEDEPEVAKMEARAALDAFEGLGAGGDADAAAALLRELGVPAARSRPKATASSPAGSTTCSPCSARGSPTPISPRASSSVARRSSTTSPASWRS